MLLVRKAELEDYQSILDITKGEFLWQGLDYLPIALQNWLKEASQESNRKNIVFTLNGAVVGFESMHFQNGGEVVSRFGFRTRKDMRGKGFGRKMLELQLDYIKENFKQAVYALSAIPDIDIPDEAISSGKFGETLVKCRKIFLRVDLNSYKMPDQLNIPDIGKSDLTTLTKEQFRRILENSEGQFSRLTSNSCLYMNWVPILPVTKDDIQFAVRKNALTLVGGDVSLPESMSILTWPFPCPAGTRCSIDLYCLTDQACIHHIYQQIRNLITSSNAATDNPTQSLTIEIALKEEQTEAAMKILKDLHLDVFRFRVSEKFNREFDSMYIYKQAL